MKKLQCLDLQVSSRDEESSKKERAATRDAIWSYAPADAQSSDYMNI